MTKEKNIEEEKIEEVKQVEETKPAEEVKKTTKPEKKEDPNKGNKIVLIIIFVTIITIALVGYLEKDEVIKLYNQIQGKENLPNNYDDKDGEEIVKPSEPEKKEEHPEEIGNSITVYYSDKEFCRNSYNGCNGSFIITTENNSANILDVYKKEYVLFKDGTKIKLYNANSKTSKDINLSSEYDYYNLVVDTKTSNPLGIIYQEKTSRPILYSYYSITLDKVLYYKKYHDLYDIDGNYLSGGVYECNKSCDFISVDLLSAREEKILNSAKATKEDTDEGSSKIFDYISNNNYRYYALATVLDGYSYNKIYDEDLKEILSFNGYGIFENSISVNDKGQIYVVNDNKLNIYDNTGKQVNSISTYDKILQLVDEYIIAIKNNKLVIATIDGLEKTICDWKDNNNYHSGLSGWYTDNGKYGIYMVVEDPTVNVDEVWNYYKDKKDTDISSKEDLNGMDLGYEYYYIPTTGEIGKIPAYIGGYAKPILYLYPEKETKVTVTFDNPERLTTTYPKYNNSWVVNAKPNGDLRDLNGKYYYGLYWEEDLNHRVNFNEGFYVTKDNAIDFLEEKLSIIGFNDRERNEFIMYWLPILEKNENSLVYFELTKERDSYSKINISPKPDSMLRVAIHVKKVNGYTNIKEQKLETFNRTGFSAVEWGGVIY